MKKKKIRSPSSNIPKETPEARKKRASSGVKFRSAVFEDRKKRRQEKFYPRRIDDEDSENE